MVNNLYHKGDLVVCIDPGSDKLTAGKTYVVLAASILPCGMDEWDLFLDIQDDLGVNGYSFAHRFQLKSEWLEVRRERQLKSLGI
jgi:hypothetical protein